MAFTQQTVVDQIEVTRNGTVQVRFNFEVLNGTNLVSTANHRTSFPHGSDVAAQMAVVNTHMVQMGNEPVSTADIAKIQAHCTTAWTPQASLPK